MYCKKCGKQFADQNKFCPGCGTPAGSVRLSERKKTAPKKPSIGIAAIAVCLVLTMVLAVLPRDDGESEKDLSAASDAAAFAETEAASVEEAEELSLAGRWTSEQGEVTFTKDGRVMFGISGIVLGNGWIDYEVISENTIYLSGGDFPIGINIQYALEQGYLGLEIGDKTVVLEKTS